MGRNSKVHWTALPLIGYQRRVQVRPSKAITAFLDGITAFKASRNRAEDEGASHIWGGST
jgi:hypothetical protein